MPHRDIPKRNLAFARAMRADSTKAENILWQALRNRQLEGMKFKRQAPMGSYIVDFVCFTEKLVVEFDGGQHSGSSGDIVRDTYLAAQGYRVLRFWNDDVLKNCDGVCLDILAAAKAS